MPNEYELNLEVDGLLAQWTRPDTGNTPGSYVAPSKSAVRGIFESIVWLQNAVVEPLWVAICQPIQWVPYSFNYGGPFRKAGQISNDNNHQVHGMALYKVCYRFHAVVRARRRDELPPSAPWARLNGAHAYFDIFNRRLDWGRYWRKPYLGTSRCLVDYCGHFRPETRVCEDINLLVPGMLITTHAGPGMPYDPVFRHVRIERGVLNYAA